MEARYLTDLEWRICHAVNIYVFRNGEDGSQPVLVHVPPSKKKNMRTLMNVIQDRVKYDVGYARFLYKMDGTRVKDPCELEMYNNYVVASNFDKHYKCAAYGRKKSPLIVLNRESKHVRVLKLQNQNYYDWLLKKKAVGEERPPYIYPTFYTNENYGPQDLPVGQMGNYNPPEVQAPGCCYPKLDTGNKTFRVDAPQQQYVANSVQVEVSPDLTNLTRLPKHIAYKQNYQNGNLGKKTIIEQTPSDILNANAMSSEFTSQEAVNVESSETDEKARLKKFRAIKNSQRKSKSLHPPLLATSEEFQTDTRVLNADSSIQSMEVIKKHHKKSNKKNKKKKSEKTFLLEPSALPPPPSQFRDDGHNTTQHMETRHHHRNIQENVLTHTKLNIYDHNGNVPPTMQAQPHSQKSFYYSPEKLAEINAAGNIQPFELTTMVQHQPNTGPGQWAVIHQPQQQMYSIGPQQAREVTARSLYTAQPNNASNFTPPQYPGVPMRPVQNLRMQHPSQPPLQQVQIQSSQGVPMLLHSPHGGPPTQCVMIQNPSTATGPVPGTHQLLTLQNPNNQSHIQHVYRLGIVQQANPQTCIQVDGKAMRQYVDNQKLIESRFGGGTGGGQLSVPSQSKTEGPRHLQRGRKTETGSELTESELDIPFTPLKTYRLNPQLAHSVSDSKLTRSSRRMIERLPKVKSRNVAIQMGYPSTNSSTGFVNLRKEAGGTEISVLHERNSNPFRNPNIVETPKNGLDSYINNPRKNRRNIYETYSEQHVKTGRSPFVQKTNVSRTSRLKLPADPVLEELVTIPPPNEFRETARFPERRHNQQLHSFVDDKSTPANNNNNNPYSNCKDTNRSNTQYSYNNYSL